MMRVFILSLFVLGLGCTNNAPVLREPDEYTGCAGDEQWRTFDDQEHNAVVADATGPAITQPDLTAPLGAKPVFQWNQDPGDPGMPTGDVPHDGPGCNQCCPQWNIGALTTAHLPPISGDVYDLQLSVGGHLDYRVITTLQEWTPPDATWAAWKGKTVSLKIWRMTVLRNDPKQGPYTPSAPLVFTVGG